MAGRIVLIVVTWAELHSQTILNPKRDRVLTIHKSATLMGFLDYYKLFQLVKEIYSSWECRLSSSCSSFGLCLRFSMSSLQYSQWILIQVASKIYKYFGFYSSITLECDTDTLLEREILYFNIIYVIVNAFVYSNLYSYHSNI